MSRRKLSDAFIRNLPPAPKGRKTRNWDTEVRGLVCVVTDKGTKSLMLSCKRPGGRRAVRLLIAHHPSCLIEQARTEAREMLAQLRAGLDPREEQRKSKRQTAVNKDNAFEKVVAVWQEVHISQLRRAREYNRVIKRELLPYWKGISVVDIDRDMVVRRVTEVGRRAPYVGHATFGVIRSFFSFVVAGSYGVAVSPCEVAPRIKPAKLFGPRKARDRQHSDLELRGFVKAAGDMPLAYSAYFLCLLYSVQRVRELSEADWSEFSGLFPGEDGVWVLPASRDKLGKERTIPISRQFVEQLNRLPRYRTGSKVFSSPQSFGTASLNSLGWATTKLKKRWLALMQEEKPGAVLPQTGLHDVRRTCRSRAPMLGIGFECAELMLGHVLPGGSIVRNYNRYTYLSELRVAYQTWADHVDQIAGGGAVVPLSRVG